MTTRTFFDSYALIELTKGNPRYATYNDHQVIITFLNLLEFLYIVLKTFGTETARAMHRKFAECVVEPDEDTIIEALAFRAQHNKRDLSYADCLGYIYARKHSLQFLTGDEQFRDLPGVEFVKA